MLIPKIKAINPKQLRQLLKQRNTASYRDWRTAVLCRDGYKCQFPHCNETKSLEVHHIRRYADSKHLRTAIYNGITLCKKHHEMIAGSERFYELAFFKIAKANQEKYERLVKEKQNESKDQNNS
jgi:hypothetical protein